jgi:hypothetical protein
MAAIRSFHNRMKIYSLSPYSKLKGKSIMQQILTNNKYDAFFLSKVNKKKKQKQEVEGIKWTKFTYVGKETRLITKIFKYTNVKVTFTADNIIDNLLAAGHNRNRNKYEKCGIYQLICTSCNIKYIGQTGRTFKVLFHEHVRDFK